MVEFGLFPVMSNRKLAFIVYEGSQIASRIPWANKRLMIGRREGVEVQFEDPTMSSVHAEIVAAQDGVRIRDLNSLNGTNLNGHRISDSLLHPGDRIQIGKTTILVAEADEEGNPLPYEAPDEDSLPPAIIEPDNESSGQTLRLRLDALRVSGTTPLAEDRRILLLRDLFETLKSLSNPEEIFAKVREVFVFAFPDARVFVLLPEGDSWVDTTTDEQPSVTFVGEAARSACALLSTSLPTDVRFANAESVKVGGIQTAIAAPILYDDETRAVVCLDRLDLPAFTKRDLHVLGIAANHVSAVLENAARITDLEQARARLATLNRDLEELVEARTAEIRRQAEEIRALADAKDELLGIAAHDIRGPLTVIQGTAELLRVGLDVHEPTTMDQNLGVIHEAALGLGRLLSELLDAKAIESGKIHLEPRRCNVESLLANAAPVAQLAADNKRIRVEIDAPSDLEIEADPHRLGQALTNLVLNAVKFSDPESSIALRAHRGETGTVIAVEDQGVGIPEQEMEQIFEGFEQGEAGKHLGGSGLGLMIAKRLIELHGGTLEVSSQVGVGTRFQLQLPDRQAETVTP